MSDLGLFCPTGFIQPLTISTAIEQIRKSRIHADRTEELVATLQEGHFEADDPLLNTPLMLTVYVLTFDVYGESLTKRITQFYERVFDTLWILHDRTKEGLYERSQPTTLTSYEFQQVLSIFSVRTYLNHQSTFTSTEMNRDLQEAIDALQFGDKATAESFLEQLTDSVCLLVLDGLTYEYTHRSFQEFYAAKYFQTLGRTALREARRELLLKGDCENVLAFVYQMDRDLFELQVVRPSIDALIGYDEANQSGDFATFFPSSIGVLELKDDALTISPSSENEMVIQLSRIYPEIPISSVTQSITLSEEILGVLRSVCTIVVRKKDERRRHR